MWCAQGSKIAPGSQDFFFYLPEYTQAHMKSRHSMIKRKNSVALLYSERSNLHLPKESPIHIHFFTQKLIHPLHIEIHFNG